MSVALFILVVCVIITIVVGLPIGAWHLIHVLRRKHRLEAQEDARQHARQVAEDFAAITKELTEGTTMDYQSYLNFETKSQTLSRKKQ
jgi:hypothetical protein